MKASSFRAGQGSRLRRLIAAAGLAVPLAALAVETAATDEARPGTAPSASLAAGPVLPATAAAALTGCAPCAAVGDGVLDGVRGGFDDGQGLRASFGIERITQVGGQPEIRLSVQIADLARITASQAEALRSALAGVTLVQSGPGNVAPPTLAVGGTVIQNTLNNQVIRNTTVLDVTSNSLQLLRALNAQTTLRDALTLPIGGR